MKKRFTTIALLFITTLSIAQIGGTSTYSFLELSNSARVAALGGNLVPVKDGDLTLAVSNPSLIDESMHNKLALSFVDYYSDISYGFVTYSRTYEKLGSFAASVQYIDYGQTMETTNFDEGDTLGYFGGSENAISIGWSKALDSLLYFGANLKLLASNLYNYSSYGVAVDLSATYYNPDRNFTASVLIKNIGRQLKTYTPDVQEDLPFEIQLGFSKRLKHVPFRYSVVFTNLQEIDLTYTNSNDSDNEPDPFTGEIEGDDKSFGDKFMRHVVIGGEFLPTKNFSLRFGYNYKVRQEMKIDTKLGTTGFSWGLGFRVSKFHLSYSRAAYHLVGSPNYITITTNLSNF